jgi:hypothetical protein
VVEFGVALNMAYAGVLLNAPHATYTFFFNRMKTTETSSESPIDARPAQKDLSVFFLSQFETVSEGLLEYHLR